MSSGRSGQFKNPPVSSQLRSWSPVRFKMCVVLYCLGVRVREDLLSS